MSWSKRKGDEALSILRRVAAWIYDRGGGAPIHRFLSTHRVPPEVGHTRKGWMYVLGQALVFVLIAQIVTGTALAMKYIPAPSHAWQSLQFINTEVVWGGFVRALHFFGASAMVTLAFAHMARVFLTGSFKFPRELSWITGIMLLFLVLVMAFTGQLLRWDRDGVATVEVAALIVSRVPVLGSRLMELVLAGESLGGATLSQYFALHVVVVPLLILGLVGFHVYLVVRNGISEPPRAGRPVDRRTYRSWYEKHKEEGNALYFPDAAWREMVFVLAVYGIVLGLAVLFGPNGPGAPPDPSLLEEVPKPDWFFLWYYTLIWYKPAALDALVLVWFPVLIFPALMAIPLLFGEGERAPSRRPWALLAVSVTFVLWATLTVFGVRPHWVPQFATEPVPESLLVNAPEEAREGARIFYDRGCQYCHVAFDRGGTYGPDLTLAPLRMSREEITVRIVMGVRNMPSFRDVLPASEIESIIAYLQWAAEAGEGVTEEDP